MSVITALLIFAAILISFLATVILILWFRGVGLLMFPGLGFVIATPFLAVMLLIGEILVIFLAMLTKSAGGNS